ncbi:MAG: hypothetical protein E3J55_02120 [Dehalococcoidia bacterium]|nr:MAG: hypothetical protein E3J55_02120 [Dehalococcoidia bacterium]
MKLYTLVAVQFSARDCRQSRIIDGVVENFHRFTAAGIRQQRFQDQGEALALRPRRACHSERSEESPDGQGKLSEESHSAQDGVLRFSVARIHLDSSE